MTATDLETNALMAKTIPASGDAASWRMLEYLPVGLFGSVMGLTGLSVAWRLAHARYGVPAVIADVIDIGHAAGVDHIGLITPKVAAGQ